MREQWGNNFGVRYNKGHRWCKHEQKWFTDIDPDKRKCPSCGYSLRYKQQWKSGVKTVRLVDAHGDVIQ